MVDILQKWHYRCLRTRFSLVTQTSVSRLQPASCDLRDKSEGRCGRWTVCVCEPPLGCGMWAVLFPAAWSVLDDFSKKWVVSVISGANRKQATVSGAGRGWWFWRQGGRADSHTSTVDRKLENGTHRGRCDVRWNDITNILCSNSVTIHFVAKRHTVLGLRCNLRTQESCRESSQSK